MAETVVFLGAGASKDLDLPLTNQLLPAILERVGSGRAFQGDRGAGAALDAAIRAIYPGWSARHAGPPTADAAVTLPSIADLLSTVDYLLDTGRAAGAAPEVANLLRVRTLLERAIFELLVRTEDPDLGMMEGIPDVVEEEWKTTHARRLLEPRSEPASALRTAVAEWMLTDVSRSGLVTLVSMNYDIEIEQEVYARIGYDRVFTAIDFGAPVREPAGGTIHSRPAAPSLALYKLHGSLNWLECPACDSLYVNPVGAIAYLSFLLEDDPGPDPWLQALARGGANQCHCGYRPLRHVLVAPSFVRSIRSPNILSAWANALAALRRAERWILIGYSLPPEDVAIRSMLLRGLQTREAPGPDVVVVQKGDADRSRYEAMFPRLEYHADGFADYVASVHRGAL